MSRLGHKLRPRFRTSGTYHSLPSISSVFQQTSGTMLPREALYEGDSNVFIWVDWWTLCSQRITLSPVTVCTTASVDDSLPPTPITAPSTIRNVYPYAPSSRTSDGYSDSDPMMQTIGFRDAVQVVGQDNDDDEHNSSFFLHLPNENEVEEEYQYDADQDYIETRTVTQDDHDLRNLYRSSVPAVAEWPSCGNGNSEVPEIPSFLGSMKKVMISSSFKTAGATATFMASTKLGKRLKSRNGFANP